MKYAIKLILICLFILPAGAMAQECKYDIKEKDKFSGKTKVSYWYQLGTEILYLHKVGENVSLEIGSSMSGAMKQGVEKGATGQFRLLNGEFVSFTASDNAEPVVKVNGAGTNYTSTIRVFYDITAGELAKLAASAPAALKVQLGSKEVVKEFSDKKGEKIKTAARCLADFHE